MICGYDIKHDLNASNMIYMQPVSKRVTMIYQIWIGCI